MKIFVFFLFFFSVIFWQVFVAYFALFSGRTESPDCKRKERGSKTQTNGEKAVPGEGMGARCRRAGFRKHGEPARRTAALASAPRRRRGTAT